MDNKKIVTQFELFRQARNNFIDSLLSEEELKNRDEIDAIEGILIEALLDVKEELENVGVEFPEED